MHAGTQRSFQAASQYRMTVEILLEQLPRLFGMDEADFHVPANQLGEDAQKGGDERPPFHVEVFEVGGANPQGAFGLGGEIQDHVVVRDVGNEVEHGSVLKDGVIGLNVPFALQEVHALLHQRRASVVVRLPQWGVRRKIGEFVEHDPHHDVAFCLGRVEMSAIVAGLCVFLVEPHVFHFHNSFHGVHLILFSQSRDEGVRNRSTVGNFLCVDGSYCYVYATMDIF